MATVQEEKEEEEEEEEPVSPGSRLMQHSVFNLHILAVLGYKTVVDVAHFKHCLSQTLAKHPRFSSLLVGKSGDRLSWKRVRVNLDNHVFAPDLDPEMDDPDKFVEDFTVGLSKTPMDARKPLWEVYVLNVRTSDARSTVIFKIDHSVGDGVSLISVVLASSKKLSDPQALPDLPVKKHGVQPHGCVGLLTRSFVLIWTLVLVLFYTLVDLLVVLVRILFVKDSKTAIKGSRGVEVSPKRFVHRVLNLDDVKLVKTAMNVSINDVMLGMTEAGISRYLNTRQGQDKKKAVRLTIAIAYNLRPSPSIQEMAEMMEKGKKLDRRWGNKVGLVIIPLNTNLQKDPLTHVNRARATMQRKKLSLGPKLIFFFLTVIMKLFGIKAAATITSRLLYSTTFAFSNVMGPVEEICLFGHHLAYISPTVYGFPQALVIHYQSYCDKLVIALAADEKLIPNPHQLCDDLQKSLENIKETVIKRGLVVSPEP